MTKWIKFNKSKWGLSAYVLFFDAFSIYMGRSDHWGIGAEISFYERSVTFQIFNLYIGLEILDKPLTEPER